MLPKPVVPLLDLPLASWALAELVASSSPVLVNAAHLPSKLVDGLAPFAPSASVEFMIERPEPYGTAGTLGALRDRLADPFVVHNADALSDLEVRSLLESHSASRAAGTIAVRLVDRGADFELDSSGAPRLVDRRRDGDARGAQYLGAAVFDRAVLELIPSERPVDLARCVLGPLAAEHRLGLYVHTGYWRDVGRLRDYLSASADLLEGRGPAPPRPWPGEIVETDGGWAYVGPGAAVTAGVLGAGAIVLGGASLGANASVRSSVVWPGERVPDGTSLAGALWALGRVLRE